MGKKSEELRRKASEVNSDLKAMGLLNKAMRSEREENFIEKWLPSVIMLYEVECRDNGSFVISTESYGKIDYYPKANKLLVRKENKWKKPGLRWIIKNLLKI